MPVTTVTSDILWRHKTCPLTVSHGLLEKGPLLVFSLLLAQDCAEQEVAMSLVVKRFSWYFRRGTYFHRGFVEAKVPLRANGPRAAGMKLGHLGSAQVKR